ncbi:hypothetical protein [Pseudoclavibacter sp. VKM Ac-2867]|uniref:hypothetical protein n=1 Tax=Pseudoclavibacter sp. VKM Ac-2867 TaxID=2783829 RepID=UPI00188A4E3F|nr:hypothetical protein [Pseudoclavibacter sp. VKM Ac-2867]MBF4459544.1 hypothetical protein [Pseudoclavibacter sp. VKM Ac-2867]
MPAPTIVHASPAVQEFAGERLAEFHANPATFGRIAASGCPEAATFARADLIASGIPPLADAVLRSTFQRKLPVTCARILADPQAFTAGHLVAALLDAWHEVAVEMLLRYVVQDSVETRHIDAVCRNLATHALDQSGGVGSGYVPGERETGDLEAVDLPSHPSRFHSTLRVRRYLAEILANPKLGIPHRMTELGFRDYAVAYPSIEHLSHDEVFMETSVDLRRKVFSDAVHEGARPSGKHLSSYLQLPKIAKGASAVGWFRQTGRAVGKSKTRDAINRHAKLVSADFARDLAASEERIGGVSREILQDEFLREQAIADRDGLDTDFELDSRDPVGVLVDALESARELAGGNRQRNSAILVLAGANVFRSSFTLPELTLPADPEELERVRVAIESTPGEVHRSLKAWHDALKGASTRDQRDIDPALVELWQHYSALEADALLGRGPQVALILARAAVAVLPTPKTDSRLAFIASITAASTDPAWAKVAARISSGFAARFCKRAPDPASQAWSNALRLALDAEDAPLGLTSADVERNLRELYLLSHLPAQAETQLLHDLLART